MKYYKKVNVERETVEEYNITKLKCDCCGGIIETGDRYADICECPKSFRDDILWKDICAECLLEYVKTATYEWEDAAYTKLEIEMKVFEPYNEQWVDELIDKEDVAEDTDER